MNEAAIKNTVEAALLAAGRPLSIDSLQALFADEQTEVDKNSLRAALVALMEDYCERGVELVEVAGGWRLQISQVYAQRVVKLWAEKPTRYSRALLETLALIAYRQPITRGEIEDVRGVSVSTSIVKTLQERDWIRVLGHREVPGRPAMYGTTRTFLDYFHLKSLESLPPLAEIRDLDNIHDDLFNGLQDERISAPADDVAAPAASASVPPQNGEIPLEEAGIPDGEAEDEARELEAATADALEDGASDNGGSGVAAPKVPDAAPEPGRS